MYVQAQVMDVWVSKKSTGPDPISCIKFAYFHAHVWTDKTRRIVGTSPLLKFFSFPFICRMAPRLFLMQMTSGYGIRNGRIVTVLPPMWEKMHVVYVRQDVRHSQVYRARHVWRMSHVLNEMSTLTGSIINKIFTPLFICRITHFNIKKKKKHVIP